MYCNGSFRFWLKAVSFVIQELGIGCKVLISDGSGLQQKSTHRVRMGAFRYQCMNRLRTNSTNCSNKLSMAISRVSLSARLVLLDRGRVLCTTASCQANHLSSTKESAFTTLRNKYLVTYYSIKLYHDVQVRQLKNTPRVSTVVGCLRLTIPSVRSLGHYKCASCSNAHTTTTNTTNTQNRRIIIVPPYEFSFIKEATHYSYFMTNQPKSERSKLVLKL